MFTKRSLLIPLAVLPVLGLGVSVSAAQEEITLSWLTHWGQQPPAKAEGLSLAPRP